MKRFVFLFLLLTVLLSGCTKSKALKGENPEYLIASMGFDYKAENYTVLMEAVVINSEDTAAEKKILLLEGRGKTVELAAENAEKKAVQPVNLSHCGVMVLNKSINKEQFHKIREYCYNRDEINLSAFFIASQNPKELLSEKAVASIAMGYDIMTRIESQRQITGREFKNRFYQIEAESYKKNPNYDIPLLSKGILSGVTDYAKQ